VSIPFRDTCTEKKQKAEFPLASVAVHVTVVVPIGKAVPEGGEQVTVVAEQLSFAVGVGYVTTTQHCPISASAATFAGHAIVGSSMSSTVTVKAQVDALPFASVAVHVTVVVPTGNGAPDGGLHATVAPGQLSLTDGVNVATAEH
jgi:hypothetical protein